MGFPHSITFYQAHFDPARLTFARELRGMTKRELATRISYTPSRITQYESGKHTPPAEAFEIIAKTLCLEPSFFSSKTLGVPKSSIGQTHFRSNVAVSQAERLRAHAYGQNVFRIFSFLEGLGICFPGVSLPQYEQPEYENGMEQMAERFRIDVGLGLGPIHDLPALLEGLGVRIIMLPESEVSLHGFASWMDGVPCMMIDSGADSGRLQFNYAHELKHLLFDEDISPNDAIVERKANRFAGAFLMPCTTFKEECPSRYRQQEFQALKEHWHVSIAAALFRGRQLGKMSEEAYRSATINRSAKGFRKKEEKDFPPAYPTMLAQAIELISNDITLANMERELGIPQDELKSILETQKVGKEAISRMLPEKKSAIIHQFKVIRKNQD